MYIDLLTQILNAQKVHKEKIKFSYSVMDEKILNIIKENKFINEFEKKGRGIKKYFDITLAYEEGGRGKINGVKFISKPSRRIYRKYRELRDVMQGYGTSIISTPKGIMTTNNARKTRVGGEVLFEIW